MYHKLKEGRVAYFDVDHTLVIWELEGEDLLSKDNSDLTGIVRLLKDRPEKLNILHNGCSFTIRPIWTHVLQLVQQKIKGVNMVVWSASGADWAEAVVKRLGLEDYVDVILTKPDFYYDDSNPEGFMGRHFFFAWDEIDGKMRGKKQKHHDFRKDIEENLDE